MGGERLGARVAARGGQFEGSFCAADELTTRSGYEGEGSRGCKGWQSGDGAGSRMDGAWSGGRGQRPRQVDTQLGYGKRTFRFEFRLRQMLGVRVGDRWTSYRA